MFLGVSTLITYDLETMGPVDDWIVGFLIIDNLLEVSYCKDFLWTMGQVRGCDYKVSLDCY